jgi:hypothetical protein
MRINTLVSNVPGPPMPLYMAGAKVVGIFPSSVILEGMGLNITVFSYMDRMDFGVQVDPDLVPDPWVIAEGIPAALAELMEKSNLGSPTPVDVPLANEPSPGASPVGGDVVSVDEPPTAETGPSSPQTPEASSASGVLV